MTLPAFGSEGWTTMLFNHLWQSTLVAGVAWLLTLALRKNHARARHAVWMAASVKFLLPFSLLVESGKWLRSLIPASSASVPGETATAIEQITQPFPQTQFPAVAATPIVTHHESLLPLLIPAIWLCGVLVVMVRFGYEWWKIRAAKRAATPLEMVAGVPILSSPSSMEPGIFGIVRPVLLLPQGIPQRLTAEQLKAIVAHEMCHVRRRDNLTYAVHMAVEALFWFHPAVWWIGVRLIDERERACDEAVVQSCSAAQVYAEGILNVCKHYFESPLECVSGVSGSDLKKRILRIMSAQRAIRLTWRTKLLLAVAVLIAIALPVTLGLVKAAAESAASAAQMASAQDIVGTWQGTLHSPEANNDLRTVVRITRTDANGYRATLYSTVMDEPIVATKTAFENGRLSFSIGMSDGKYEGKMSADGKTLAGTWMEDSNPLPLNLKRTLPDAAWPIPGPVKEMAADANPRLEATTVKPSRQGELGKGFRYEDRHFAAFNTDVNDLIAFAYGLHARQIVAHPAGSPPTVLTLMACPMCREIQTSGRWQGCCKSCCPAGLRSSFITRPASFRSMRSGLPAAGQR